MSSITTDNPAVLSPDLSIKPLGRSRILYWLRLGWLVLAVCLFAFFLFSIPGTYKMLETPCPPPDSACANIWQARSAQLEQLKQSGISLQSIALYIVVLYAIVSLVFWAVGLL